MPASTPVKVVPYDPHWPRLFQEEAFHIQSALGDNCITIHHIGSTSVPGLAAKPVIDIMPEVLDILAVIQAREAMYKLGYEFKGENGIPFRRYFQKEHSTTSCTYNVHVFQTKDANIERHLKFRDWMRTHESDRKAYAALKLELAARFPENMTSYWMGKNEFISKINTQAGINMCRMMVALTLPEWEAYHRIRESEIFNASSVVYDRNHFTMSHPNHIHFVLYSDSGKKIVAGAHIELLTDDRGVIRTLSVDKAYQRQGYGEKMMTLLEQWIKHQGKRRIVLHANPNAHQFYRKLGYVDVIFEDQSMIQNPIDLGKTLV